MSKLKEQPYQKQSLAADVCSHDTGNEAASVGGNNRNEATCGEGRVRSSNILKNKNKKKTKQKQVDCRPVIRQKSLFLKLSPFKVNLTFIHQKNMFRTLHEECKVESWKGKSQDSLNNFISILVFEGTYCTSPIQ